MKPPGQFFYSILLYLKTTVAAQEIFSNFNCFQLTNKEEYMYILFVNKVYIQKQQSFSPEGVQNTLFQKQLPSCVTCLERLDPSSTFCNFDSLQNLNIYDIQGRWTEI